MPLFSDAWPSKNSCMWNVNCIVFLKWTEILGAGRRSCEERIQDVSVVPPFAAFIFRPWAELVLLCAVFVWADDPPPVTYVTHLHWLFTVRLTYVADEFGEHYLLFISKNGVTLIKCVLLAKTGSSSCWAGTVYCLVLIFCLSVL